MAGITQARRHRKRRRRRRRDGERSASDSSDSSSSEESGGSGRGGKETGERQPKEEELEEGELVEEAPEEELEEGELVRADRRPSILLLLLWYQQTLLPPWIELRKRAHDKIVQLDEDVPFQGQWRGLRCAGWPRVIVCSAPRAG